ncbi:hypothetical protein F0562_030327 [Nyssa sinensis]|uniref:Uncharacterized protein n=1 Tax=Nyssa sinensis TaxID=561372 RepID=A0A5J5AY30_9ASTE|nr:hypothetical protein F0562_030327 [Nyssa sinensis]
MHHAWVMNRDSGQYAMEADHSVRHVVSSEEEDDELDKDENILRCFMIFMFDCGLALTLLLIDGILPGISSHCLGDVSLGVAFGCSEVVEMEEWDLSDVEMKLCLGGKLKDFQVR